MFAIFFFILLLLVLWAYSKQERPRARKYGQASVTLREETVRSNAERIIADYFTKNNIRYEYEREVRSSGLVFNKQISHPDFYLHDYDVYVEYWGLVNADDEKIRTRYVRNMKWKMAQYYKYNIKFISIYPNNLSNLDWIFRKKNSKRDWIKTLLIPLCAHLARALARMFKSSKNLNNCESKEKKSLSCQPQKVKVHG